MQPISAEIVRKTWQEQAQMSPLEVPQLINRISKQQPLLLAYLMAVDQGILNQDERELLLYLGIAVWRMMSQGDKKLVKVSEKRLEQAIQKNEKMLEYLEGEPTQNFDQTVEMIFKDYNQKEVLKYVIEALFEEEEDEEENIRDEVKGLMAMDLKTVIDCLDQ
ncbi:MAG: hypothetical protein ONB05_02280 [candidate division KSB1 bacterium]|nr:hypothetical protein [candidate division KSB1 bacterium]